MGDLLSEALKQAIVSLHSDIKNGPDFVYTCCHHLMYRSVVLCNIPSVEMMCVQY